MQANAGNSLVIVNVIVYELTGSFAPQAAFQGRSSTRFGLKELVDLTFSASPNLSSQQVGGLTWKILSGNGSIPSNTDGSETYTAGAIAGDDTFKLEILDGPSKGLGPEYTKTVVAPNEGYVRQTPGTSILHCQGYCSIGFYGEARIQPTDVSFEKLWFREGVGSRRGPNRNLQFQHFLCQRLVHLAH